MKKYYLLILNGVLTIENKTRNSITKIDVSNQTRNNYLIFQIDTDVDIKRQIHRSTIKPSKIPIK